MPGFEFSNYSLEIILIVASTLLIFSVLASRMTSIFGVPSLLIFLGVGMLAGSEGPGQIEFTDYSLSFAIGSVSLAIIIFDGGMRTSWDSVRSILPVGVSLSSIGVIMTALLTGAFAHYAFHMSWTEGLLLGAIVSSTDAAAVFSILRAKSLELRGKLKQILEFEAGSNDPMAIFLTIGVLTYATAKAESGASLLILFLKQAGLGFLLGWLAGKGVRWLVNKSGLEYEGLYSVLLLGFVIFVFSGTAWLGGSGFLAVYVMGIMIGNSEMLYKRTILQFHDGIAWIAQITVFLALGLLSFPSHLLNVWEEGLALALFLMFVARPLSVLIAAPIRVFDKKERTFISWVGLRGAAPIILATLPWSVNFPNAEYYFNLVFFVVLISVAVQGMSIPWVANQLKIIQVAGTEQVKDLDLGILPAGFVNVRIDLLSEAPAKHKRIVDLALPSGILLTSLKRGDRFIIPKGSTVLQPGDQIQGLARPSNLETLKDIFGSAISG